MWFVLLTIIHWIAIYPVDSFIQPLKSRGQAYTKTTAKKRSCIFVLFSSGKGRRRLAVYEEVHPMTRNGSFRWARGWDCGWTQYGLCFSPDWRVDIHDNFIIPFEDLTSSVYVDEPANSMEFRVGSAVLTRFSQKKDALWEGDVRAYWKGYNWVKHIVEIYSIDVKTNYRDLKHQLEESFHPSEVLLKGNAR